MVNRGGHKRGQHWEHFSKPYNEYGKSTKRTKCNHFQKSVLVTSGNMKAHLANCNRAPRLVGRMKPLSQVSVDSVHSVSLAPASLYMASLKGKVTATRLIADLIVARVTPEITNYMKDHIDGFFGNAVRQTCTHFDIFTHAVWRRFFQHLLPNWSNPSPIRIITTLVDGSYSVAMMQMCDDVRAA